MDLDSGSSAQIRFDSWDCCMKKLLQTVLKSLQVGTNKVQPEENSINKTVKINNGATFK